MNSILWIKRTRMWNDHGSHRDRTRYREAWEIDNGERRGRRSGQAEKVFQFEAISLPVRGWMACIQIIEYGSPSEVEWVALWSGRESDDCGGKSGKLDRENVREGHRVIERRETMEEKREGLTCARGRGSTRKPELQAIIVRGRISNYSIRLGH